MTSESMRLVQALIKASNAFFKSMNADGYGLTTRSENDQMFIIDEKLPQFQKVDDDGHTFWEQQDRIVGSLTLKWTILK